MTLNNGNKDGLAIKGNVLVARTQMILFWDTVGTREQDTRLLHSLSLVSPGLSVGYMYKGHGLQFIVVTSHVVG